MTRPPAVGTVATLKSAEVEPCNTVTVVGTLVAALLVESAMPMFPATFEMLTTQAALDPAVIVAQGQLSESSAGVDHRVNLAVAEDAPSVAVRVPVVSARMLPIEEVKLPVELPAAMVTLAGTEASAEEELRATLVLLAGACDRVTVQTVPAPDISPVTIQDSDLTVTVTATARLMLADCDVPL